MKLTTVLLLATMLQVSARTYSQQVSLKFNNATLDKVFAEIEKQSGYSFIYGKKLLQTAHPVSISINNVSVEAAVQAVLSKQPLGFKINNKYVIISPKADNPESSANALQAAPPLVRGRITNENGEPVAGVTIKVKDGKVVGISGANGEFELTNIDKDAILVFSSLNMEQLEIKLQGRTELAFVMKTVVSSLDEVVMIGYGSSVRREATASIASITAEDIKKQPVQNPLNALQGRVAGAVITQANGLPGSRVTIQIRGQNSIDPTGAGVQPLFLIDGVPFNMNDNSFPVSNDLNSRGAFAAAGGLSPFSMINPEDIERIDILKDADATAIYGTRGSNGVVMITTKKGKAGKTKVDVKLYRGWGKVAHYIPMMNTQQYLAMRKQAFANDGITPTAANAPDLVTWDQNAYTDWQRTLMGGTAGTSDAQATISGGDQRTRFLLNAGYHHETPVFPGSYKSDRISTRLNVDHSSLDKRFNANASVLYSYDNTNLLGNDLSTLYNLPPNMPVKNADGTYFWQSYYLNNPAAYQLIGYYGKTHNLLTNVMLRYTVLPGLDIKTSVGYNSVSLDQNTRTPGVAKNPFAGATLTNSSLFAYINQRSYIVEPQITYNRNISLGKLSTLVGATFHNSQNTSLKLNGDNYSSLALMGSYASAGTFSTPSTSYVQYRYNSLFGRATYNWDGKYILNAVLRRDGSSRFGANNKFGTFWDLGAAWVFTNESFAQSLKFLSFGKLRASYGKTGNDQIADYSFAATYGAGTAYQGVPALNPSRIDNPNLHWQSTYKMEFGLDLAFLKKRIELTANYYRNRTPDQLGYINLSSQVGFNSTVANFDALIQNRGFEVELTTHNIAKKDFTWNTSFNITIPRTRLITASPQYFYYNPQTLGQPLSAVLRYIYQGVDKATGNPVYKNMTKDTLTFTPNYSSDRGVIGYTAPKMYGGINNTFNYKGIELSFFFQFTKQDGNIYPNTSPGNLDNGNQTAYWLDNVWTKAGDNASKPRYTTGGNYTGAYAYYGSSSASWGDASFLKLRTVYLAYNLPREVLKKMKIDNFRIYLQGQNLWTATKNKYAFDPETGTSMPPLRMLTTGINVTF
ncbi:SusC/RagA family TonB-linked outer membrane protein [Filimonas lacunae]|nr:SusC/RagA family TonB-linked outer membrane protein [Filimonas lacunae]BAV07552.1 TonB-dependent receptor [Filimonas lacunae]